MSGVSGSEDGGRQRRSHGLHASCCALCLGLTSSVTRFRVNPTASLIPKVLDVIYRPCEPSLSGCIALGWRSNTAESVRSGNAYRGPDASGPRGRP